MVSTRSQFFKENNKEKKKRPPCDETKAQVPAETKNEEPKPARKPNRPERIPQPVGLPFELQPAYYGLIQERIRSSLYALVVQVILWNQTHGTAARPILFSLLSAYPTPFHLSQAVFAELAAMLQPIGLHNVRARRLIALGETWVRAPPCKERRYRKLHYPARGCGRDVKPGEILELDDERVGWEIAHLPGMGPYALDSYRMFYRDELRGVTSGEPEWKRVVPNDKDLRPYLKWRWAGEGWDWNEYTGERTRIEAAAALTSSAASQPGKEESCKA